MCTTVDLTSISSSQCSSIFQQADLGEDTVQLMKTVKKAIDPLNIMNPGKVCMGLSSIFVRKLYPDKDNVEC